tara:strand:- start:60 stop:212 length:153 start_codon:yes stop_codon:yes gene_type:complete
MLDLNKSELEYIDKVNALTKERDEARHRRDEILRELVSIQRKLKDICNGG